MNASHPTLSEIGGKGCCMNELPADYQDTVVKEYFERSIYATIMKLRNGRFLVYNIVICNYVPAPTWEEAKCIRYAIARRYWEMDKVFMGGREAYAFLKARNSIV
jgi:hypothetical protein